MLFPWNAFINAGPYFKDKLAHQTRFGQFIENDFELTFQLSHLLVLLLSVRFQHLFSTTSRITYPLFVQGLVFLLLAAMVHMDGSTTFFWCTITLSLIAGGATSVYQSGMFGLAGMLPPKYTQAIMAGQSMGAIIVALLYIIFLEVMPSNNASGLAFFQVSVACILCCLCCCYKLRAQPLVEFYMKASAVSQAGSGPRLQTPGDQSYADGRSPRPDFDSLLRQIGILRAPYLLTCVAVTYAVTLAVFPGLADAIVGSSMWYQGPMCGQCRCWEIHSDWCGCFTADALDNIAAGQAPTGRADYSDCLAALDFTSVVEGSSSACFRNFDLDVTTCSLAGGQNLIQYLSPDPWAFYINASEPSVSVFGQATDSVAESCAKKGSCCYSTCMKVLQGREDACSDCEASSLWLPVCVFLLFNVGEMLGRTFVGLEQAVPCKYLWILAAARIAFIPLFMMCRFKQSYVPTVFHSDLFPATFIFFFSFSNGVSGSLAMMYGPEQVSQQDRQTAGSMMVTALTVGLNSGSILSYGLKAIVTHEAPF